MTLRRPLLCLLAILVGACASTPSRPPATAREDVQRRAPLVVVLVVDQLRSSYLESYGQHFTGGLKRLMDEGAWYRQAAYPYLNTVTCAGHATIGTGALPYRHGMVLNAWWDRETRRSRPCTEDPAVKNIGYTGTASGGDSAASLRLKPLGQQLREATGGRTVVMSLKARSAITMAGSDPTAVTWFDERAGWSTSTAFTKAPQEWLQTYVTANRFTDDRGKPWERLLPVSSYTGADDADGEREPSGWTKVFPHVVGQPMASFNTHWQRSPFADAYLGRLAAHAIDTLELGRGTGIDFLGVSFSTLDLVGHQYGPRSHEVQDVLFRLDRTIGALLEHLDARVGRGQYVLALTSDHGVAELPEQSGGGRQSSTDIIAAIDKTLAPFFGPARYVAHTVYTDIYLHPGVLDRLRQKPQVAVAVLEALRSLPGIAHAFLADDVRGAGARRSSDPVKRAAALNYHAGRSGDLIVVPREHWLLSTAATTHGTLWPYDQRVPVIFFGAGVTAGRHDTPATPADIAPTLAALAGARFARTDGVPLMTVR